MAVTDRRIRRTGRFGFLAALGLTLCLLSACRAGTDVIVAGSTSVQPYAEVLAEEYAILYPGNEIDVQGGGSAAGIMAAETGAANIGMSSRNLKDSEQGLWSVEIAKDGLAVIVHPDNPIGDLTFEQVRDIYSGKIVNWSDLGGDRAKIHIITREEGSGTRDAFESLMMAKVLISPKAIVQDSNGAVRQLVSSDPYAIGFISMGLVDGPQFEEPVKAIWLEGVAPTRENVIDGSYSLYRPFLFVTSAPPDGPAKQFIDFVLSPEGQRILEHEGLISIISDPDAQVG